MERTHRLYLDEQISADGFARTYGPLEQRLKQIEDQVPALQGEADFLKIQLSSGEESLSEARDLYGRWADLTFEEKCKIIDTIVERIDFDGSEVAISLAWIPSSAELASKGQRNLTDSSRGFSMPAAQALTCKIAGKCECRCFCRRTRHPEALHIYRIPQRRPKLLCGNRLVNGPLS